MTALNEILAWSTTAPAWLRDALRRIVTASEVSEQDVRDLVELCKSPHGLSTSAAIPDALSAEHVPAVSESGAVSLASITHVSDVNALAPNETLTFAPAGLTVIYGDNGAGKSGFTRIVRRACRARGGDEAILANALSDKPAGAPTAKIDYAHGGVGRSHTWRDGTPADAELSAVSVFDTTSAQVYIEEKTEVRFRPFGLDVIDRAASVCLRVKKALETEADALRASALKLPPLPSNTDAGRLLAGLTALTPHAEVDRLAKLSGDEEKELENLSTVLAAARAEDPRKKAADLKLKSGRLQRLLDEVRQLGDALADARIDEVLAATTEASGAAEDARHFAAGFAKEFVLAGAGSAEWNKLWGAAKEYSEKHAYPGKSFPHVSDGAACVLCQQELDDKAQARMSRFAAFVVGKVREEAQRKNDEAERVRRPIRELRIGERNKDALAELQSSNPDVAAKVEAFLSSARDCQTDITAGVSKPRRCTVAGPVAEMAAVIADLEALADAFARAADPAARARSEAQLAELNARRTLGASLPDVHAEIDRRARLNAYDPCIRDTDTRGLTKLGVDLTKKYVTDALTKGFEAELTVLGFSALELELKPASGQRGQLFHKIQLKHATRAELPRVVSEGESRCIALAAFMAELTGAAHQSAIVFDDPVSSLDHRWRSRVARRLVEAARTRQVIVFTHELVFLAALIQDAEKEGVLAETRTVSRDREFAGHVATGLPWHGLTTKKRIGQLRDRWVKAEKIYRTAGQDEYDPLATSVYAHLRTTWERAIEEVLLNQVVLRFRPSIETQRLKKIGDISAEDLETIEKGMTKSSKWEGGHDQASAMNEHLPAPDELKEDLDMLENWVAAVEKRRR
jgi:ABC-type hemin transport system ATPase subunit